MKKIFTYGCVAVALSGCSTTSNYSTAYPYKFQQDKYEEKDIKRVLVASMNFGPATKNYLIDREFYIDQQVKDYLNKNGFEVVSDDILNTYWNQARSGKSSLYDKYTGAKNQIAFAKTLRDTLIKLKEADIADVIIFTDLVALQVQFSAIGRHQAKWDGVIRKPELQGAGSDGVSTEFNWYQPVDAVSLAVNWVDMDGQIVFSSRGGLEVTEKIDSRTSERFVRSKKILKNDRFIDQGIQLAFHPIIEMKDYPGFERK